MLESEISSIIDSKSYVLSRWNYLFSIDNEHYIYNTFSCGFGKLDPKMFKFVKKIETSQSYTPTKKEIPLVKALLQGSIIVQTDTNELNQLKFLSRTRRYNDSQKVISMTIVPTLDCNFRCSYCFQEHQNDSKNHLYMNRKTQDAIVKYVELRAKNGAKRISICWYGGEPLLAYDTINLLTERFLKLSDKYSIPYDASMVSNGYLLDKKRIDLLLRWRIVDFQVTVDGPKEIHDKRRPLVSGKPTYSKIIKNICNLTNEKGFPSISLRVNLDETNKNYLDDLLNDLNKKGLMNKLGVYLAPVTSTTKSCGEISSVIFSSKDMIEKDIQFVNTLIDKNLVVTMNYPKASVTQCMAVCPESNLVGPDGTLWPCWDVVGRKEESIGNIRTGCIHNDTFLKWCLWDPFEDEECLDCKVLPICMGGCPARRVPLNSDYFTAVFEKKCSRWRWGMEEYLKLVIKLYNMKQEQSKKQKTIEETDD